VVVPLPGPVVRVHFWLAPPVQVQICTCIPRIVFEYTSPRARERK
jgi:hypothetical protein